MLVLKYILNLFTSFHAIFIATDIFSPTNVFILWWYCFLIQCPTGCKHILFVFNTWCNKYDCFPVEVKMRWRNIVKWRQCWWKCQTKIHRVILVLDWVFAVESSLWDFYFLVFKAVICLVIILFKVLG